MPFDFLKKGFNEAKKLAKETNKHYKTHKGTIKRVGEGAGRLSENALDSLGGYPMIDITPKKQKRFRKKKGSFEKKLDDMYYV